MEDIKKKKRGRKIGQLKHPRTDIRLTILRLSANKHFGSQLKEYRLIMRISLTEMGKRIGFHSSNIYHYENNNGSYKSNVNQLTETAIKYARALGAEKIEITL